MIKHLLSIFSGRKQPGIAGLGDSLLPKLIFDRETLRILAVNVNPGKVDPHSPFQIDPLKNDFKKGLKKAC